MMNITNEDSISYYDDFFFFSIMYQKHHIH